MNNVMMSNTAFDDAIRQEGYPLIAGVDEAGRGPLAGPVCAAAVIFSPDHIPQGLNDSKKLSEKKREALFEPIMQSALAYCIAFGTVEEIEDVNILQATFLAMRRAVEGLSVSPSLVLIDGDKIPAGLTLPARNVVKGDGLSASIAAASILAKVSRDRLMYEWDKEYPQYGFAGHKGYGTAAHYVAIRQYGPCPIHRMSFLKKMKGVGQ